MLGGEPSGHIIFRQYSTTGDGLLAALKVFECTKYYNRPLKELLSEVKLFPQVLKNIYVREKVPFEKIPAVQERINLAKEQLGDNGRLLIRYSGTENLARVMVEGREANQVEQLASHIAEAIKQELGVKTES